MLGECTHPHIKGLIMQRHNTATQHIAQAIRQSPLQTIQAYLWMDAGKDVSPHLQDGSHTLPSWLLPNLDSTQRRQFRPDILYIPGWNGDIWYNDTVPVELKASTTIYLLEVGYGPDTRYEDKRAEKLTQHVALAQLLRDEGWSVADPSVFILGVGGSIYKCTRHILASTFQLPNSVIDNLVHKLQRHALGTAHQIVATRRFLERSTQQITPPHSTQRASPLELNSPEVLQAGAPLQKNYTRGPAGRGSPPIELHPRSSRQGLLSN